MSNAWTPAAEEAWEREAFDRLDAEEAERLLAAKLVSRPKKGRRRKWAPISDPQWWLVCRAVCSRRRRVQPGRSRGAT